MEQKRFLLSFLTLLLSTIMYAQQEITGTVTDAFGPVIGATVMEKGTTNGTVTDFDGNFKLKVEAGKMLVFSYVGYLTQELPAANGMEVAMKEDSKQLQEVVVTGYTTQRKADLTGAVSTVSVDELAKQNSCAWYEHCSRWFALRQCNGTYPWYRHAEQQRSALHY